MLLKESDHEPGEVGHEAQRCPNCIERRMLQGLSRSDWFALNWYYSNATSFVKDFNMMPSLIDRLCLDKGEREVLLLKLSLIHEKEVEGQIEDMEKRIKK